MSDRQETVQHLVDLLNMLYDLKTAVGFKLRDLGEDVDKKQRDMNIAKTAFASTGIVASGLAIGGVIAAPFTFGASLGLTIAGISVGVASGVGGISTAVAERIVNGNAMKDAEAAVAEYMTQLNEFVDTANQLASLNIDNVELGHILENIQAGIRNDEIKKRMTTLIRGLKCASQVGKATYDIVKNVKSAIVVADAAADVAGAAGKALTTGTKALQIGGAVFTALTIPIDVHTIVTNSIKIHKKTPSVVGEQIRDMARTLDQHEILQAADESEE